MADSDKTLKLLIELGVIGQQDAEAVKKSLEETKGGADALAKEMGVLTVSASEAEKILAQTGESSSETGRKIEDSSEKVKTHSARAREMHHTFGELNRIVPGLGTALKMAFQPDSIGIIGSLLAFEALKDTLESIKEIDEIKLADFTGEKEVVDAVRESYEKTRVSAQLFVDEQKRLNDAGLTADEVAKQQIENYKNLASAQEQFNAAQEKLGEADIDEREKKGVITHASALKEKFALDVEYARRKLQLEAQMDAAELAAKQQQLATQKSELAAVQKDRAADEANAAAAAAAKEKHDKQKEIAQENIESAQNTLEELGKNHASGLSQVQGIVNDETAEQLKEYYEKYVGDSTGKNHTEMLQAVRDKMTTLTSKASWDLGLTKFLDRTVGKGSDAEWAKYDGAKQQIASARQEIKKLEETQFKVDLNAERGEKQLEATDEAIRKLSASVESLQREIPQMKADAAAKLNNNAAAQNLDLRADAVAKGLPDPGSIFRATNTPISTSTPPPTVDNPTPWRYDFNQPPLPPAQSPEDRARNDFSLAEHARDVTTAGGKLSDNQMEIVRQIAERMTSHAVRSDQVLVLLKEIMATQQSRDAAFERELDTLRSQLTNTRSGYHSG